MATPVKNDAAASSSPAVVGEEPDGALIKITVISASNLRDADRGIGGGKSDPFVLVKRIYKSGKKEEVRKTHTTYNTLDPRWDPQPVDVDDFDLEDALEFEVRDADVGKSDLLGVVRVEAEKLLPYGFEGELNLEQTKGFGSKLTIKVEVLRIPKALRRDARKAAEEYAEEEAIAAGATIKVRIKAAVGLRNADRAASLVGMGSSDPYVILKRYPGPAYENQTEVISDTVNPIWHTPAFDVRHVPVEGPSLYFEVRDKDPTGQGDLLGNITVDASKFIPDGFGGPLYLENGGKGYEPPNEPALLVDIQVVELPPDPNELRIKGLKDACILACGEPQKENTEDEGGFLGFVHDVRDKFIDVAGQIDDVVEEAQVAIEHVVHEAGRSLQRRADFWNELTTKLGAVIDMWLKKQLLKQIEIALDSLPVTIKHSLNSDPDMFRKVWKAECRVVDTVWPDIRRELLREVEVMLKVVPADRPPKDSQEPGPGRFMAYFRYLWYPYNKSFWGKARSPIYVFTQLVFFLPESAISSIVILLRFIVIDKKDEYSLMQYILSTKAVQFTSHFFIRMFFGYILYLNCVLGSPHIHQSTCAEQGPAMLGPAWFLVLGWLVQLVLPYLAVMCLPFAKPHKSRASCREDSDSSDEDEEKPKSDFHKQFGAYKDSAKHMMNHVFNSDKKHIRNVIIYDLICLAGVISCFLSVLFTNDADMNNYIVRNTFLACQVTYGFLSLPFFLFGLPIVDRILLHTRRTGYDSKGRIRFYRGAEKPPRSINDQLADSLKGVDTDEVMDSLLGLFGADVELKEGDIFHEYAEYTVVRPRKCKSCKAKLRGGGSKGFKCGMCNHIVCKNCGPVGKTVKCPKKDELKKKQLAAEKAGGQDPNANPDEQPAEGGGMFSGWGHMSELQEYWNMAKGMVNSLKELGTDGGAKVEQFKEMIRVWVKRQSHGYIEILIAQVPDILKYQLETPDMPRLASRGKNQAIDLFWAEMHQEIMYSMQVALDGKVVTTEDLPPPKCMDPLRAALRHAFMPYDKSIFWQVKNPWFWVLTLLPMIPYSLFVPGTFFIIFIVIDKQDEFQLINFILRFKGAQFITFGFIKNILGFYTYVSCTSHVPAGTHTCSESGPGLLSDSDFAFELGGLIAQIVLCWSAFCLLPLSKDKGRTTLSGDLTAEEEPDSEDEGEGPVDAVAEQKKKCCDFQQGGHFRWLLFYDIACALTCFGILLGMCSNRGWNLHWSIKQGFFGLQILYGYMGAPFFFFNLPVFKTVLTHSVMTGYDAAGRIRLLQGPGVREPEVMEKQLEELKKLQEEKEKRDAAKKSAHKSAEEDEDTLIEQIKDVVNEVWYGEDSDDEKDGKKKDSKDGKKKEDKE